MTNQINDYFNNGIVLETFQAQRNILIWKLIAGEVAFFKSEPKDVQKLYHFIQQAAQANFTLALGKLYDNPSRQYQTRCISSFLQLLNQQVEPIQIIETTNTKKLLKAFKCDESLIKAVHDQDHTKFPRLFEEYYSKKYKEQTLQENIQKLKIMRDKVIAHNEVESTLLLDFHTTEELINFATEIISIFGMAYHSTIWKTETYSIIMRNAENDTDFINSNIQMLKERKKHIVEGF